jgi:uncharacterized protein YqgC (DUF456 family)
MGFILWILSLILIVVGIVQLIQGQILFGIILIVVGLLLGGGGFGVPTRRRTTI